MHKHLWQLAMMRKIGEVTSSMVVDVPKDISAELNRLSFDCLGIPVEDLQAELDTVFLVMSKWAKDEFKGWEPLSLLSGGV